MLVDCSGVALIKVLSRITSFGKASPTSSDDDENSFGSCSGVLQGLERVDDKVTVWKI